MKPDNKKEPSKHRYCRHWDHKYHEYTTDKYGNSTCGTCGKPIRWFEVGLLVEGRRK